MLGKVLVTEKDGSEKADLSDIIAETKVYASYTATACRSADTWA